MTGIRRLLFTTPALIAPDAAARLRQRLEEIGYARRYP
jgi:hypothetical protein